MTQLDLGFAAYATPACNGARKRNAPPEPDANWLFDADGVREIAGRRQCAVTMTSEITADVFGSVYKSAAANPRIMPAGMPKPITLTAMQPGRWHPVDILAACTKANGNTPYGVDMEKAIITNPGIGDGRLDEVKVARVVGADGMRPYLSKKSRYLEIYGNATSPLKYPAEVELGHGGIPNPFKRAPAGKPTWAFTRIICGAMPGSRRAGPHHDQDYRVRRALRALEDVGLVDIVLGPRGGLATARVTWKQRAMLPPQLSLYDHDAIGEIAAGRI